MELIRYVRDWWMARKLAKIVGGWEELDRIADNARRAMEEDDD